MNEAFEKKTLHESPGRIRISAWASVAGFLPAFLLLAIAVISAGYFYYRSYERHFRSEVEQRLFAVAELKIRELAEWRWERLGDGAVFFENSDFSSLVRGYLEAPGNSAKQSRIETWLRRIQTAHAYDRVFLLDTNSVERLSVSLTSESTSESALTLPALTVALSLCSKRVSMLDFYRDGPSGEIHLAVTIPILDREDNERPLGVLVLRIDPSVYLYPFIQRWPAPGTTAETLLVRREGDETVFLNELRFQKNTALSLRRSLKDVQLPAVKAALGQEGIVDGPDYRGVPVVAAVGAVPNSPWFLAACMDAAEMYAPLNERLRLIVILIATWLIGAGAVFSLLRRLQSIRFYRERYAAAPALQRSENELRARNSELTRFTYTVSHDLKSPLVTIQTFLGYLEQDLEKKDRAEIDKDLGFISNAAFKMSRLLDDLLALSRIGRKMNPPEEVSLQAVVQDALLLAAGRIAERGARVIVTDEPVVLYCDRNRIAEVFQNLLDNAVKFMGDQTSPTVEIGVDQTGNEPVLFVRDNGIGIDPRHQSKLFGLFEKLDSSGEGTGIGLALVRRIVEVHGGRVSVESAGIGKGACFRFTLAGTGIAAKKENTK